MMANDERKDVIFFFYKSKDVWIVISFRKVSGTTGHPKGQASSIRDFLEIKSPNWKGPSWNWRSRVTCLTLVCLPTVFKTFLSWSSSFHLFHSGGQIHHPLKCCFSWSEFWKVLPLCWAQPATLILLHWSSFQTKTIPLQHDSLSAAEDLNCDASVSCSHSALHKYLSQRGLPENIPRRIGFPVPLSSWLSSCPNFRTETGLQR